MDACAAGDDCAFQEIFQRMGPALHRLFQRSFQSPTLADDLVQTVFLKLHRARGSWRPGTPVRPWLFAVAGRVRIDELRRRYGSLASKMADEDAFERAVESAAEGETAERSLADAQVREAVRHALDRLPEPQRVVVHLHRYEDMGFGEIAKALGTTEGAVKLRAFRAYERLRKDLGSLLGELAS